MADLLIHVSRRAMACEFEVRFPAERYRQGTEAALEALDVVERLEAELSYFQPGSEISRINALAGDGPVEVSPALFELLGLAMTLYEETEGAYDITATPLWEAWGFARRAGEIPSDAQLAEARARVGGRLVELDAQRHTIRFRRPGMRINLGSIGKGHALDVASQRLTELGVADFLFHGGQSSVLARGFRAPDLPDERPPELRHWEIGIRYLRSRAGAWASCGSRTVPWGRLPGNSNPFGIGGTAMDTSSIRARVGRPRGCSRPRWWPPRPHWPMPCRRPSTSWGATARSTIVESALKSGRC